MSENSGAKQFAVYIREAYQSDARVAYLTYYGNVDVSMKQLWAAYMIVFDICINVFHPNFLYIRSPQKRFFFKSVKP